MLYSALWVSYYGTRNGTPMQSNTENKRSNPTTVVKIQRLTFKYRREWLIYDYSSVRFAGNASMAVVGLGECAQKSRLSKEPADSPPSRLKSLCCIKALTQNSQCNDLSRHEYEANVTE